MVWGITWIDVSLFLLACVAFLYYQGTKTFGFFKKRGIKHGGQLPFVGNMGPIFLGKKHLNEVLLDGYKKYKNERYYGNFFFTFPELVIRDVDLIKEITIKNFDHFTDHFQVPDERDPLHFHSLFSLKGKSWHQMRTTLSPAFTGSKMKGMIPFVIECTEKLMTHLDQQWITTKEEGREYIDLELKETVSKISIDIIASCAFGLKMDSLADTENTFFQMSKALTNIKVKDGMKVIISKIFPILNKVMKVKLMEQRLEDYFKFIVTDIIRVRNKTGEVRKDMIHLLMLAMKGTLKNQEDDQTHDDVGFATVKEDLEATSSKRTWTDDEITAQAVIFLFAGFETLSTMMTFISYELTRHPDVQARLMQEVDEYIERTGGMIKYEDIRSLTYMDMVMSETLRLWPPMGNTDRVCVKPFTIMSQDNTPEYTIGKDETIRISIYSIHMDPENFPEPEKFNPERFSDENKDSIKPFTFIPFGLGPRSCIGNRFAIMEIKVVLFYLLASYEIVSNPKTPYPLVIKPHPFLMQSTTGFWFGLKKRQK